MQAFISEIVPAGSVDFSDELFTKVYFSGCDFKCQYCNTPGLLETKFEHEKNLKEVFSEMNNQVGTVIGVFATGGEPCFQKLALISLFSKAKELRLKTALDTNGSKSDVIEALLRKELVDVVIMDVKAPFNDSFEKVTKSATFFKPSTDIIDEIKETLQVLKAYDEKTEIIFRTVIIPGLMFRKEDLLKIGEEIEGINCVWELQPFKNFMVKDKKMRDINSPTEQFMRNMHEQVQKELPSINIRLIL